MIMEKLLKDAMQFGDIQSELRQEFIKADYN